MGKFGGRPVMRTNKHIWIEAITCHKESECQHTIHHILCFVKKKSSRKDCNKATHLRDNLSRILTIPVLHAIRVGINKQFRISQKRGIQWCTRFGNPAQLSVHPTMLSPECVSYHRDRKFCCYLAGLPVLILDTYLLILSNATPNQSCSQQSGPRTGQL